MRPSDDIVAAEDADRGRVFRPSSSDSDSPSSSASVSGVLPREFIYKIVASMASAGILKARFESNRLPP